jgi:hypothetical protein
MTSPREHRQLAKVAILVFALAVIFVAEPAQAMPVPMCDELGQTIAAPPPVMPSRGGEITALACPEKVNLFFDRGTEPPTPDSFSVPSGPERGMALFSQLPPPPRSRARIAQPDAALDLAGFASRVYHPPRVAG